MVVVNVGKYVDVQYPVPECGRCDIPGDLGFLCDKAAVLSGNICNTDNEKREEYNIRRVSGKPYENFKWIKLAEGNVCDVCKRVLNLPAPRYRTLRSCIGSILPVHTWRFWLHWVKTPCFIFVKGPPHRRQYMYHVLLVSCWITCITHTVLCTYAKNLCVRQAIPLTKSCMNENGQY